MSFTQADFDAYQRDHPGEPVKAIQCDRWNLTVEVLAVGEILAIVRDPRVGEHAVSLQRLAPLPPTKKGVVAVWIDFRTYGDGSLRLTNAYAPGHPYFDSAPPGWENERRFVIYLDALGAHDDRDELLRLVRWARKLLSQECHDWHANAKQWVLMADAAMTAHPEQKRGGE